MTPWKNLVVALVAAFALAACSSSDNGTASTPDPTPTVDLAAERTDINAKITAARTAVAGLTDDASDAAIGSAESAVADAKTAVTDSSVPDSEKAAFNTAIEVIEGNLGTSKMSIAEARDDDAEAMAKANAKTGMELHAALGPNQGGTSALANIATPTLDATGLAIDAAAGAGALDDTDDPPSVPLEAGDSAGALGSWNGMDYAHSAGTGDDLVTNEARVYTNPGAAERVAFNATSSGLTVADATAGTYTVLTGNAAQVAGSAFVHHGTQAHEFNAPGAAEFVTQGTYLGAPGEYRCAGESCSSTNDGSGSPSALAGTWTFKPDAGAMVSDPDDHYLYYGWWVRKDSKGMPTAASAFVGRVGTDPGDSTDGLDPAEDLSTLTGSATYVGNAAGKFAMSNPLDGTGNGGHFTANAMLSAKFSGTERGVTGTIDNFRLNDGSEDPGWSVALNNGGLGGAGVIMAPTGDDALGTVWSINGNEALASGTWSGTMYDEMPGNAPDGDGSNIPTTVTGTFYSEFSSIGRMVGAFGADKQ